MARRAPVLVLLALLSLCGRTAIAATPEIEQSLRMAVARCWNPPPRASGAVTVRFELQANGSVVGTPRVTGLASPGVAKAAIHAVQFCQPYRLPQERFSDWQHATVKLMTDGSH